MQFDSFFSAISKTPLQIFSDNFANALQNNFYTKANGDLPKWLAAINNLPHINPSSIQLNSSAITIGDSHNITAEQSQQLNTSLKALHPWRKGPFKLFDTYLDTEWHSDWKWDRVLPHIKPLKNKMILDVGCGSGYHCWRMRGEGASFVLGIDPSPKFLMQYLALQHYINDPAVQFLPLRGEDLPSNMQLFDTTFSMGILYHRKSPFAHLEELKDTLKPGGELILETLIIEGDINTVLVPEDRYACMPNVFFIPSAEAVCHWLKRSGFTDVRVVDINKTSIEEQRSTAWMTFHSLENFLDPNDHNKTIEGYPAPLRGTFIATKPEK